MSTYYSFYIGYRTKDGKYHAFGPYDRDRKLRPVLEKSRSFISDLYLEFSPVFIENMDDELKEFFTYTSHLGGDVDGLSTSLKWLPAANLPDTNYIKSGFFSADEIEEYLFVEDNEPCFTESYTILEYTMKLSTAVKNNDTEEIEKLKKFNYFAYPDYNCKEYESFILNQSISFNGPFSDYIIRESVKKSGQELDEIIILLDIN